MNEAEDGTDRAILQAVSVLYVEDDDGLREELAAFLRRHCGRVDVARDGQDGLEKFRAGRPDVVLTDVRMPVMDGLDMADRIKKQDKETPIVLLTAYNDTEYLVRAIDIGLDAYVKKPADPEEIAAAICRLARSRFQDRELERAKQHYRQIVETTQEGIWETDVSGQTAFVNERLAAMLGYRTDEMLGRPLLDFMSDESRELAASRLGLCIEPAGTGAECTQSFEAEFKRKDGTGIWTAVATSPMRDEEGRFAGALGAVMDISDRKRAERALAQEKAFSDAIIGAAPGAFVVIDQQNNYVRWNGLVNALTGLSDEQLRTTSVLSSVDENDRSLAAAKMLVGFATGAARAELRVPTRDRGMRTCLFSARRFAVDATPYLAGIVLDMTEQRQVEQAVRADKAFSDAVIANGPGFFCVLDDEGNLRRWNSYVNRLTGLSDPALLKMPMLLNVHEDDRPFAAAAMKEVFANGYAQCELRLLSRDRGVRSFLFLARRLDAGGMSYLVGVGFDITERRAEEEAEHGASIDALTGIPDRAHFLELAERERVRMRRFGHPLSLGMVDVDRFDGADGPMSDLALQAVVRTAQQHLRDADILGRVGGEGFAVLLPEADVERTVVVAERLKRAVDNIRVPVEGGPAARCIVSMGIAALREDDAGIERVLERAGRALNDAKRAGNGGICVTDR